MTFKSISRFISTLTASALMLGLFAFAPNTFAAPQLTFSPSPADTYIKGTGDYEVSVKLTGYQADLPVDFYVNKFPQAPTTKIESHTFSKEGELFKFTWNGDAASVGTYGFAVKGNGVSLNGNFKVVEAPKLGFSPDPAATYTIGSGNYKVSVALTNYLSDTDVTFYVYKKGGAVVPLETKTLTGNTTQDFLWNGNQATAGTYVVKVTAKDKDGNILTPLTWEFEAKDKEIVVPTPTLDFNPTPSATYVLGSGNYQANVRLTNYAASTTVDAYIENKAALQLVKIATITYDANETNIFSWDGKLNGQTVNPGAYQIRFVGKDANNKELAVLTRDFTVTNQADNTLCAGYKDVKASDPSCDAVEWAKDEGIMTGQGNGDYFDGASPMNRAEAAKISLEAYNEYNANMDYCNGVKPFPDVQLGQWFTNYVCRGAAIKMITGYLQGIYAGMFKPSNQVTVVESMALFLRPLNINMPAGCNYTGLECNAWYSGYAEYSMNNGLYPGNSLSPTTLMTRYKVAEFLYELHLNGKL